MKKTISTLLASVLAVSSLSGMTVFAETTAEAAEAETGSYLYGIMTIPYSDFYAAEGILADSVDAVTTATTNKWKASEEGGLVAGTYSTDLEAENGAILGVSYPVRISEEDYERYTENQETILASNPSITLFDGQEAEDTASYVLSNVSDTNSYEAFKTVTVSETEDGYALSFSVVTYTDETAEPVSLNDFVPEESIQFTTDTNYGDYEIDFGSTDTIDAQNHITAPSGGLYVDGNVCWYNTEGVVVVDDDYEIDPEAETNVCMGTIAGVLVTMDDGSVYAMRALENIWLQKLAWSVGAVTTVHGGEVSYEDYASTQGKTITEITFLTDSGYYTLDYEQYLTPCDLESEVTVSSQDGMVITLDLSALDESYSFSSLSYSSGRTSVELTADIDYTYEDGVISLVEGSEHVITDTEYQVSFVSESYANRITVSFSLSE